MSLVFNEVSFLPFLKDDYELVQKFDDLLKVLIYVKEKYELSSVIFPKDIHTLEVLSNRTFVDWITNIPHPRMRDTILSIIRKPYVEDILEDKGELLNKFYFDNELIKEKYCEGLVIGLLKGKVMLSLNTNVCWGTYEINFKEIIDENFNTKDVSVKNITVKEHVDFVNNELLYSQELKLKKCELDSSQKTISLRDDHGKDILKNFAKRLVKSEYIVSVINSLPFNPNDKALIRNVYADGKIEIVLYWEDQGFGMIVQTTGRNIRETKEISEIILKKYDK